MNPPLHDVTYVVPGLGTDGGIQTFARSAAMHLVDFNVQMVDTAQLPHRRPAPVLANFLRSAARKRVAALGTRQGRHRPPSLTHFWWPADAWGQPCVNYVVTCHGTEVLPSSTPRGWRHHGWRKGLLNADAITTPSSFTRDVLIDRYSLPAESVHVVHPAVAERELVVSDASPHTFRVGVVSRLVPRKNIARCIQAAEILQDTLGVPVEFHLAGTGKLADELHGALSSSRVDGVYWGSISEEEKWQSFLPNLDVFLLPTLPSASDIEGFGIVYLEANSVGVPVVASAVGGVTDAVADSVSGFFADPEDPESIADAARRALAGGTGLRKSAREWSKGFSPTRLSDELAVIYNAALAP